jgi:hypothetical protein
MDAMAGRGCWSRVGRGNTGTEHGFGLQPLFSFSFKKIKCKFGSLDRVLDQGGVDLWGNPVK